MTIISNISFAVTDFNSSLQSNEIEKYLSF